MKTSGIWFTIILGAILDISDVAKINSLKRSAEEAFLDQNYEQAALSYSMLLDSMQVIDDHALLNLGHAYYQLADSSNALTSYQKLTLSEDKKLQSIAYQQLGMLSSQPNELTKSLQYFKQSIKSDPTNEDARFNYELVKKKLEEQEQNQDQQQQDEQNQENQEQNQEQEEQNKDQQEQNQDQQQDEQNQEQQDQEQQENDQNQEQQEQQQQEEGDQSEEQQEQQQGEQSEQEQQQQEQQEGEEGEESEEQQEQPQPSPGEKLEEMNISEETARMILEAMRNSEVQYLQQMKKKATKKADSKKPDW